MDYVVRKARKGDNLNIARTIAYSFEKTFSVFTKDMERMAKVFENGVAVDRFYVAEHNEEIIGIVACGDCTGRALGTTKDECKKYLGLFRGQMAFRVIRSELMLPHNYPATTGYIDVIGVLQQARGKGVASELLKELVKNNPQYNEFVLDVESVNTSAIKIYANFGFVEFKHVPFTKIFKRSRIFMKYTLPGPMAMPCQFK